MLDRVNARLGALTRGGASSGAPVRQRVRAVGVMLAVLASPNILKNKMLCNLICHLNHLKEDLDLTRRGSGELIS